MANPSALSARAYYSEAVNCREFTVLTGKATLRIGRTDGQAQEYGRRTSFR